MSEVYTIDAAAFPEMEDVADKVLLIEKAEVAMYDRLCRELENGSIERAGAVLQLMQEMSIV